MTLVRLAVEAAGPLTTLQDAGRAGLMRFGVPASGPVDRLAFAAAHAALGNPPGGTAVELSLGGIALRCLEGEVGFALTGGDFAARVDGAALGPSTTGVLRAGERLAVRDGAIGNWAILAFAGDLAAPRWLGSSATHALASLGGGTVRAGDVLTIEARPPAQARVLPLPPADAGPVRIVPGPQERWFAPDALATLLGFGFTAGAAFDRMGLVLGGPPLPPRSLDMLSSPLVRGALQANGAGVLTLLLADHQSTGGYPRLATVIGADVDRLAQARAGAAVRFVAVTAAEAVAAARTAAAATAAYLRRVAATEETLAERLAWANLIDGVVDAGRT